MPAYAFADLQLLLVCVGSQQLEATSCDVGVPNEIPLDKSARKVAELAQLVQGSPPSFNDLEAFLFREPDVKLPVLDAKYYSLVAANEGLVSQIEPASKSGAEALATVVTTALSMQYEPVADEISLAGVQLRCLAKHGSALFARVRLRTLRCIQMLGGCAVNT